MATGGFAIYTTLMDNTDIPPDFEPYQGRNDYAKLEVEVPMRDGVGLHTVILMPRHTKPAPVLLTRTPYGANNPLKSGFASPMLAANLGPVWHDFLDAGYILVFQDVRGKFKSDGDYRMYRAPGDGNTDHVTDSWDTVAWLCEHVPDNNGRVGIIGVSYPGWLSLIPLLDPHPALRSAVPINPVVDAWMGDDFFHNGAFRLFELEYFYRQTTSKDNAHNPPYGHYDVYSFYLAAGNAANAARLLLGNKPLPAWDRMARATDYDAFWQAQALDRDLAKLDTLKVPTLNVHAWFDAEDNYGATAAHAVLKDKPGAPYHFVSGPWEHGQCMGDGSSSGKMRWHADTSLWFRQNVMLPFLNEHLQDGPAANIAPATVFETGRNTWQTNSAWPPSGSTPANLYLAAGGRLSFAPPNTSGHTSYVSDPAKPVPFKVRPIASRYRVHPPWSSWLTDDQRPFADRPDVLVFSTDVLDTPVTLSGSVFADLLASTTGSDADWVVKLIDAYPDEFPRQPELGGYQLMVSGDILRGRFRERFDQSAPITPGVHRYSVRLPHLNHTFRRGHRIMLQIQSSWFPLYDRNPQTFVQSIHDAPADAYQTATHTIHHGGAQASCLRVLLT